MLGLVGLIRAAAGYVGNDSGPMHLAAALGVPTVGVFGSSSPAWTGPRGPRAAAVTAAGFECQPCFLKACPREALHVELPFQISEAKLRLTARIKKSTIEWKMLDSHGATINTCSIQNRAETDPEP